MTGVQTCALPICLRPHAPEEIRRDTEIDRHDDEASEDRSPERDDPFRSILAPDDDWISGLKAGSTQAVVAGESYTLGGDVITAVDGSPVTTLEQLRAILGSHKPGDKVSIEAYRGSRKVALTIALGRQPSA